VKFNELNLSADLLAEIEKAGFVEASPIQEQTIPLALEGKDVIGQAQTGTGKTAAFGLPTLEKIRTEEATIQALVIAPTRELAVQSQEELFRFGRSKGVKVRSVYGGSSIEKQIKALKSGAHIVVGTPGRLLDHISRKTLRLDNIETLVLDDNPTISKVTGSRPTGPMRSDWSKMYHVHILFDKIIAETRARHIILSYNNDGFMSKDFIESTLKRYGFENTYTCLSIDYKKYNNTKCQGKEGHVEYLFYIEKKPTESVVVESPLNYTGSKSKMIDIIKQHLPAQPFNTLIDVFGGGFNVGINIPSNETIYNDINPFVKGLIESFRTDVYSYLMYVSRLIKKYSLAPDNKEGYLALREKYNETPIEKRDPKMLYTLILYGFQQQIRFNTNHGFNNPAGSRWFNEFLLSKFISFARCSRNKNVVYTNVSFEQLIDRVTPETFVYADPPYRSTLGVYNDGKRGFEGWTIRHEQNLCEFFDQINERGSYFMLSYVLRVDDFYNQEVAGWAEEHNYRVIDIDVPQGRYNNRREVLITNY